MADNGDPQGRDRASKQPEEPRAERLLALFLGGLLLFNFPLLALFSSEARLFGLPLLFVYLFVVWAGFIVCLRLILGPPKRGRGH